MPGDDAIATAEIRSASDADIPTLAAIAEQAYGVYAPRLGGKQPPAMRPDFAAFTASGNAWVTVGAGQVLAYVLAAPGSRAEPGDAGDDTWVIDNIAVAPAAQGRGLGRRLLVLAENEGRRRGFGRAALITNIVMTENQALYRRLGWRETGQRRRKGMTIIDYAKALT
ncbi:MAG: N-acetyltransferase [Pseudomonadota bacterium]